MQRAAVAAHKALKDVPQADFCALFVPAASIAVWILQQAPQLAQRDHLHILVAQATEYQALDSGRWFQFIPWLLGRPSMRIHVSLVGDLAPPGTVSPTDPTAHPESGVPTDATKGESELRAKLDHRLQSRSWAAVKAMAPAEMHLGTVRTWSEHGAGSPDSPRVPDLCVVFSPILFMNHDALLSEDGLLPLLRARVPMALFSSSEAEHLVDAYVLAAAGLHLNGADYWPNPWALPTPATDQRGGIHAKMAWSAEVDKVPLNAFPDQHLMREIGAVLGYLEGSPESERLGRDAILSLGEPLRAAPLSQGAQDAGVDPDAVSVLIRLPHDTAVDSSGGHVYQLQEHHALLLDVGPVPASVMDTFPGNDDLLLRAIWATAVHRDFVAPVAQHVDAALVSHFSALDEAVSA